MTANSQKKGPYKYKLLLVDDSWVLRRVLRGTLSQQDNIEIVGEATNGVEALELILKLSPDVILLDAEMPLMDGMTTLQHLMIHTPIPTIILSGLSDYGSARCFDALKYGAIDFVNKNKFFQGTNESEHSRLVTRKVLDASRVSVSPIDLMYQRSESGALSGAMKKIVFCEECGTKNSVNSWQLTGQSIECQKCGEEISFSEEKRYQRMNYITVFGAGSSGYANLLQIIPSLNPEMGGALFVMIHDQPRYVTSFVRYLDAISDFQVVEGEDGMSVESGCCYVFSKQQWVEISAFSGHYKLKVEAIPGETESRVIDNLMRSVSSLLSHRVTGVLLSGEESDGLKGLEAIRQKKGCCLVLSPEHCLHKHMTTVPSQRLKLRTNQDTAAIVSEVKRNHFTAKANVVTA